MLGGHLILNKIVGAYLIKGQVKYVNFHDTYFIYFKILDGILHIKQRFAINP